jgi:hypothetical protein
MFVIVALVVSVVPVGVAVLALLGRALPWVVFGLLMWAMFGRGHRYYGPRRYRRWEDGWSSAPRPEPAPPPAAEPPRGELPIDIQVKVEQIKRKVELLLGYASRFPPFSQDLYLVRQTASEYLPKTIEAFRSLPREAQDRPIGASGKTARQELKEQLELLDKKLDEIAEDLQRRDLDRLLANRKFLQTRFLLRDGQTLFDGATEAAKTA